MPNRSIKAKPAKPYKDFPLFPHLSGQWAKKIKGKLHYFGAWEDWEGALKRYKRERDDLQLGLTPQREDGFTFKEMINKFLTLERGQFLAGEVSERTFENYKDIGLLMANTLGRTKHVSSLRPNDSAKMRQAFGSNKSPSTLRVKIGYVKAFFAWAYRNEEIERLPRYGDAFAKPSKLAIRRARTAKPKRLLTADQIRGLIDAARPRYKPGVLLGKASCPSSSPPSTGSCVDRAIGIKIQSPLLPHVQAANNQPFRSVFLAGRGFGVGCRRPLALRSIERTSCCQPRSPPPRRVFFWKKCSILPLEVSLRPDTSIGARKMS